jgi:putative RNA 2'-phosphotransferase
MSDDRLFRTIIHAFRHDPWKYGLELDESGFAPLAALVEGLRFDRYDWALLREADVDEIVRNRGDGRFELRGGRIRALYGHSVSLGASPDVATPPELLFHGTGLDALPLISEFGLTPMNRCFVHLTSDRDYALRVANVKNPCIVLEVNALAAHHADGIFRRGNEHVWLTDRVEPRFLLSPRQGP